MYKNVKAEQARAGMTNQQVANVLGLSRRGYENKLKTGHFTINECRKLCEMFSCGFDYLFATTE